MKGHSSRYGSVLSLSAGSTPPASRREYRLWAEVASEGGSWTVTAHLSAPAGSALRYEVQARKGGQPETPVCSEAAEFTVGEDGDFALTGLRFGTGIDQLCDVDLKVFDGNALVGSLALRLPD